MTKKILTPLTPMTAGYRVVVVQKANPDGTYGAYIGCMLQTPDHPDDGPMMLLGDAFKEFKAHTAKQQSKRRKRRARTMLAQSDT
jgi:hypothetical protein